MSRAHDRIRREPPRRRVDHREVTRQARATRKISENTSRCSPNETERRSATMGAPNRLRLVVLLDIAGYSRSTAQSRAHFEDELREAVLRAYTNERLELEL